MLLVVLGIAIIWWGGRSERKKAKEVEGVGLGELDRETTESQERLMGSVC